MNHAIAAKKFSLTLVISTLAVLFLMVLRGKTSNRQNYYEKDKTEDSANAINPLDGCHHVFLDVGSNVGIQVCY